VQPGYPQLRPIGAFRKDQPAIRLEIYSHFLEHLLLLLLHFNPQARDHNSNNDP
jgi:hypothetical protein